MQNLRPKCTVIEALARTLLCAVLLFAGGAAWAGQVVGIVEHLSGPLMDRKADGTVKVLAVKSEVESGDTLVAEKNTYAQIRFIDNSEITLRPGTTFKIDDFAYDADKPDGDSAVFSLVKGGLRSITGLLGKRNKEKFQLKTPAATIGIRGTTFIAQWVEEAAAVRSAAPTPTPGQVNPGLVPGLHVAVLGGGDNAFENALYVAGRGAASVRVYARHVRAQQQFVRRLAPQQVAVGPYHVDPASLSVDGQAYDMLLVFYGWEPCVDFTDGLDLRHTPAGFIATDAATAHDTIPDR